MKLEFMPPYIRDFIKKLGYQTNTNMEGKISEWAGWYNANNSYYSSNETDGTVEFKVDRISLMPAKMAADEWASLLMTEKTQITSEDEVVNQYINDYFRDFVIDNAEFISTSFGYGTGAWVLNVTGFDEYNLAQSANIRIDRLDANQIFPLTVKSGECTECAFITGVTLDGKHLTQLQLHVKEDDYYHIKTYLFNKNRQEYSDTIIEDLNTYSGKQTFSFVSPAIPNKYSVGSSYGVSIFDDALGAVKLVDEACNSMYNYLYLGKPLIFMDDSLIDRDPSTGNALVYRAKDQQMFRKINAGENGKQIEQFTPDLQVDNNRNAINTALQLLSMRCGFGNNYFSFDKGYGVKTATEVNADNSALFRNIKRHENALTKSIVRLVEGALGIARGTFGLSIPDAKINVFFDDSIITDTASDKALMLQEISVLGSQRLKEIYLEKFYGMTPEEASDAIDTPVQMEF